MASVGLSNEQWLIMRDMVNNYKTCTDERITGKYDKIPWIIDTGASNHMTANLKCMTDLREVVGYPVGLPDGQHTIATKERSVRLSENLKLENVLSVPSLKCNLISVSQLIDEVDCIVQFTKILCVMQGRTSRMPIGAGERKDGLYYFRVVPQAMAIKNGSDSLDLWHKRLGHPSLRVTKLVSNVIPTNDSEMMNKDCDVCQRAKQTRDRFPLIVVDNGSVDDDFERDIGVEHGEHQLVINMSGSQVNEVQDVQEMGEGDMSIIQEVVGIEEQNNEPQLGLAHRIKQQPARLCDYLTNTIRKLSPSTSSPATTHTSAITTSNAY
ncbi:hypothetical protein KY284_020418 [Solanum tuberosum]|nr:hypothetical protein KY284_020418 [Solanum tuberosum]